MPRDDPDDLDDLDDDDDDWPDDDDDESSVLPCPSCGAEIFEDAVRCPHCGDDVPRRPLRAWEGRPRWWILLGLIGVAAVAVALVLR